MPIGVVNPPSTTNDPVVTNAGLWITPQKYVIPSGIWDQSSTTWTEMNMWFFHISGYIGEFVGVGLKVKLILFYILFFMQNFPQKRLNI